MSSEDDTPSIPKPFFLQAYVPYLTKLAYISSPFITTFMLIHLSAPALANLGGSSLSSQTMILGREYYQTPFGEKYLVLGPIAAHALTGLIKRLISKEKPRPLRSMLSLTGYSTMFLFLPIHFLTHRVYPTTASGPIYSVGPAELDLEFVKLGLQKWPWLSWTLYIGLVGSIGLHLADGASIIWNAWFQGAFSRTRGRRSRIVQSLIAFVLPTLAGLWSISKEPLTTLSSTAKRFEAVFTQNWLYRIF